jgi:hypothetical protein
MGMNDLGHPLDDFYDERPEAMGEWPPMNPDLVICSRKVTEFSEKDKTVLG